mgnify:CR=1 FL=1
MILQALKEYYDRKAADPDSGIAPLGWERKEIPFLVVLNEDGMPVAIEDTREHVEKKIRAKSFLVPQSVKRAMGIASPPASSQCNTGYWLAGARFLQVLNVLSLAC